MYRLFQELMSTLHQMMLARQHHAAFRFEMENFSNQVL